MHDYTSLIIVITLHLLIIKISVPVISLLLNYKLFKMYLILFFLSVYPYKHTVVP